MQPPSFKMCPVCHQQTNLESLVYNQCGHKFLTDFSSAQGPRNTQTQAFMPPPYPQASYPPQSQFGYTQLPRQPVPLYELERRYREANKTFVITMIAGFFLWPIWYLTYLEYTKKNDIKRDVAAMGIDPEAWSRYIS